MLSGYQLMLRNTTNHTNSCLRGNNIALEKLSLVWAATDFNIHWAIYHSDSYLSLIEASDNTDITIDMSPSYF